MSAPGLDLSWSPPGPVAEAFMASRARVQVLNGPVGSGKTTAAFVKAVMIAAKIQQPSTKYRARAQGESVMRPLRKFKLTIVRDDYRQLWRSTIPSWWKRFPRDMPGSEWSGSVNAPARHQINFAMPDGTMTEFIAEFIAIGDNAAEDVMRGYEPTAWYLNESDRLAKEVYQFARTRWGRYPGMEEGGPSWWGILMDCNAPELGDWLYEDMFLNTPADAALFRQPGGMSPGAENLQNLPPGYYEDMRVGMDAYLARRMIDNLPGYSRSGKPVHEEFNEALHVAPADLEPVPGLPLLIGLDGGLDPAAAIGQKLGNGRWHIIDEIASEHGTGAIRFAGNLNELLHDRYPDWHLMPLRLPIEDALEGGGFPGGWRPEHDRRSPLVAQLRAWCDPAATYGGDRSSAAEADRTWQELVGYHTGIRIEPAPSNDATTRREGLRRVLTLMPDGKPAFQLSPRCKMLRAGLAGMFRYRKLSLVREDRYTDEVDKNAHSHPCEALEYLMLGGGEGAEIHERRQRGWDTRALPRETADEWGAM